MCLTYAKEGVEVLAVSAIATVLMIVLSIIYFGLTLWVVKVASANFFGAIPDPNWAVISAAILTTGTILAGALEKKR